MMKIKLFLHWHILLLVCGGLYVSCQHSTPSKQRVSEKSEAPRLVDSNELQNGDLIFQTSRSSQSLPIQLATKSRYSHCGILYQENGAFYVFEAVQPVKQTPLDQWIARGEGGHYVVKRLKNAGEVLTPEALQQMKRVGEDFNGKDYDLAFDWSDDKIYCSELIWKVYQRATGLEIGQPQRLRDFDLSHPTVAAKLKERYGNRIPLDAIVISPAAVFESGLLRRVVGN